MGERCFTLLLRTNWLDSDHIRPMRSANSEESRMFEHVFFWYHQRDILRNFHQENAVLIFRFAADWVTRQFWIARVDLIRM
jgi:hypothetical protein